MPRPRIAVVEDEPIISADLGDRLTDLGYQISGSFQTGEEAIQHLRRNPPDLVLLDVQLAGQLDGVETAAAIRQFSQVPLIFLTSNSDEATYRRARAVRPNAFLSKPFRGRDLVHAIDLALATHDNSESAQAVAEPVLPEGESALVLQDRLFIKVKDRLARIMLQDVLWVEADDYYCKVITADREYLVTKTLKKFSALLPAESPFVRCHRSYLINLNQITEIGEIFIFIGKHKLPVSRSKRAMVMSRLGQL